MQVQGQLEVFDLDECDFFQVKIEEYENYEEYKKDSQDKIGFTNEDLPKGYTITYLDEINKEKFKYLYCPLFSSDTEIEKWREEKMKYLQENSLTFHEEKYWKITRYECTLVKRDREWFQEAYKNIEQFWNDVLKYREEGTNGIFEKYKKDTKSSYKKKSSPKQKKAVKRKAKVIKKVSNTGFLYESD